jgi:hypothetical protein
VIKKTLVITISFIALLAVIGIPSYTFVQQREKSESKHWTIPEDAVGGWSSQESNLTTNAFKITGEEWKIYWSFNGWCEGAICNVTIYDVYTDKIVRTISLTYEQKEAYLKQRGRFYLNIKVYGSIDYWYLDIAEMKD